MTRIAHLLHCLATWLIAIDGVIETSEVRDWSDLPVYHPASDTDH